MRRFAMLPPAFVLIVLLATTAPAAAQEPRALCPDRPGLGTPPAPWRRGPW